MHDLLQSGLFVKLNRGPSNSDLLKTMKLIKTSSCIGENIKNSSIPSIANCNRSYSLPKILKIGIPLRPVVSNIGSASYPLLNFWLTDFIFFRFSIYTLFIAVVLFVNRIRNFPLFPFAHCFFRCYFSV